MERPRFSIVFIMKRSLVLCVIPILFLGACGENRAPVSVHGSSPGVGSSGAHIVMNGDTLYSISKRYKIAMPDIALANRLNAPFALRIGQVLRLPPPPEYRVRRGDTLFEVARIFNTSQSQIARLNNLRSPYVLRVGQVLRLPSAQSRVQVASAASSKAVAPKSQSAAAKSNSVMPPQPSAKVQVPNQAQQQTQAQAARPATPAEKKYRVTKAPPKRSSSKFLQPVEGKIVSSFGPKQNGLHNDGINIAAAKGTAVKSAENGVVVYAGSELKGSGNLVLVRHEGGYMTAYAHMDDILIKRGATVTRGQTIGTVGQTGSVSSPQLHFEVRRGTRAINPKQYLGGGA